jgi:hypothetical protein
MQISIWSKSLPAATTNVRVYAKTFEVHDSWCEVNFVGSCITMYNMWCLCEDVWGSWLLVWGELCGFMHYNVQYVMFVCFMPQIQGIERKRQMHY